MDEPKILVAIRKRPLSKKEQSRAQTDIISVKNRETVIVSEYKQKVDLTKYLEETVFNFDFAFDQNTNNQQIYQSAVRPLVDSAFQGAKVTCFAYGQTGSGKTFTMNGNTKMGVSGLYTLGATDIFAYLSDPRFRHLTAKLSFFEIYCGKLFDLLNKRSELTLRQDNKSNINIIGLEETPVDTLQRFQQLLTYGSIQRVTSQNSANNESSRSHAILQVTLKEGKKIFGKISFIDLAGNQRGADHTDMKKQTRIDGAEINKSLLSLKECIRALDQGKGHTPFRGSKLTMVLKDSFVGFCRTIMIGNVSPSSASSENTLNTLRYADRVKELRKPTETLSKEEQRARQMMLPRQNNNAIKIDINKDDDADDIEMKRRQAQKNYGIKEEPKPTRDIQQRDIQQRDIQQRDIQQREMSSDPYRKNPDTQRSRQQSFGGPPLGLSRPLVGGMKQSQQNNIVDSPVANPVDQGINKQPKSPAVGNNIGKINLPTTQTKGPLSSQRNGFQNNNSQYQGPEAYRGNSNQGMYDNRMDIQSTSMTNSQVLSRQNNYMGNNYQNYSSVNNNQPQYYGNQGYNQPNQYQPNQYQNNQYGNNQYRPTQFQNQPQYQQPLYANNNNNQQQNVISARITQNQNQAVDRLGQYRSNYQQPDQRPHSANREQYQPQGMQYNKINQYKPPPPKIQIPQDFEGMVQFVSTTNDPQLKYEVHQRLHEQLLVEENNLVDNHSETLRSSLDCLKTEMSLITELQKNRDAVSTREYLGLMQQSIDQKISLLEELRQKMIQFRYKLERVEEIDENNENMGHRGEDEQLLDDLH